MSSSKFFCEICNVGFDYLSKYQLHLRRSSHRALEDVVNKASSSSDALTCGVIFLGTAACLSPKRMRLSFVFFTSLFT